MLSNGILETTATTGTGDLTTSAVTGRPRFTDKFTANSTEASASHFYYSILTQDTPPQFLESGIGYMSAVGTMKRIVVLSTYASSTYTDTGSITAATLPSGIKNVICTAESGSAAGMGIPGTDAGLSAVRYAYSSHIPAQGGNLTLAVTANRLYFQPFLNQCSRPIDALFCRVSVGVSGNLRMGLFECNKDGTAGRLLMGSTADTAISAPGVYTITTGGPARPTTTWLYVALVCDSANTFNILSAWTINPNPLGHDGTSNQYSYGYLANGSTTIANPASALTTKVSAAPIAMGVRYVA